MTKVFPWVSLAVIAYTANELMFKVPLSAHILSWAGLAFELSLSDAIVGVALLLLLAELLFAASSLQWETNTNHVLSGLIWAACIALFVGLAGFRTPTFALVTLISTIDVVAGIWVTLRLAPKYVAIDRGIAWTGRAGG